MGPATALQSSGTLMQLEQRFTTGDYSDNEVNSHLRPAETNQGDGLPTLTGWDRAVNSSVGLPVVAHCNRASTTNQDSNPTARVLGNQLLCRHVDAAR